MSGSDSAAIAAVQSAAGDVGWALVASPKGTSFLSATEVSSTEATAAAGIATVGGIVEGDRSGGVGVGWGGTMGTQPLNTLPEEGSDELPAGVPLRCVDCRKF